MAKLTSLSLEELYEKPKFSAATIKAIVSKSDFTKINHIYCEKVCTLKCKNPKEVILNPLETDILIIQDHRNPPGKFDKREGQQDQMQGAVIDFIAKLAGFTGLKYRLTSLSKCPASTQDFGGKIATASTMQKCFPYLKEEILKAKPKIIISLGTATTKALGLKKHSNTGNRGEIAFSEYGPVVVTLHPRILTYIRQNAKGSAGIWGPDYLRVIQRDFQKAADFVRGKLKYTPTTLQESIARIKVEQLTIARSLQDVLKIRQRIDALGPNVVVSFDTETTSLDPADPNLKLLSLQFGWRDQETKKIVAAVIPLWHVKNTYYDANEAWKIVEPILTGPRPKAGHNSKYDILVIHWAKGVRVRNVRFDTLLPLHSIESGTQGCYGLKAACWDHLLELGFAGYEDALGDLKQIKKAKEKALAESEDGEEGSEEDGEDERPQPQPQPSGEMYALSEELFK